MNRKPKLLIARLAFFLVCCTWDFLMGCIAGAGFVLLFIFIDWITDGKIGIPLNINF